MLKNSIFTKQIKYEAIHSQKCVIDLDNASSDSNEEGEEDSHDHNDHEYIHHSNFHIHDKEESCGD